MNNQNIYSLDPQQMELNRLQQIQQQQQQQQQQFAYHPQQQNIYGSVPTGINNTLYNAVGGHIQNNTQSGYTSPPLVMHHHQQQGMNLISPSNPIMTYNNISTTPPLQQLQQQPPQHIYYQPQPQTIYNQVQPQVQPISIPIANTVLPQQAMLSPVLSSNGAVSPPIINTIKTVSPTLQSHQNQTINHDINTDNDDDENGDDNDDEKKDEIEQMEEEEEEEKISDDDYQSESSEGSVDSEDNDAYFKKSKQEPLQEVNSRKRTANKISIKFLSDSEEEEEDESSDYESPKKKGKKKTLGKRGRKPLAEKKKKPISNIEREYEILAAQSSRSTRQRRTTSRLFNEITESHESGDEEDQDNQEIAEESESEDSDDDYQSDASDSSIKPKRKSTTRNSKNNNDVYMNSNFEEEPNSEEEDYTSDSDAGNKKRKRKFTRSRKQQSNDVSGNSMTHLNLRKRGDNSNLMFDSDEENEEVQGEYDTYDEDVKPQIPVSLVVEAPIDEDTIEKVFDHRLKNNIGKIDNDSNNNNNNNEPPPISDVDLVNPLNYEFLVKWKGWAHIHNTWDSYESLINFKGNKKLVNYCKSLIEMVHWRKDASREDIEQADIQRELNRKEYMEYVNVERIIATREVEPTIAMVQQTQNNSDTNTSSTKSTTQYLCKWESLHYCDVTWEFTEDISDKFQSQIDDFLIRTQTQLSTKANSLSAKKRLEIGFEPLEKQPDYLSAGNLRDYQLEGLNWLIHSWFKNTNVILADEMGLGKTIQTISFLSYLNVEQQMPGPFLVVVPLSTIENWQREFTKWAPQINVVLYNGASNSRSIIREYEFYTYSKAGKKKVNFNVLLTTYEFIVRDKMYLGSFKWEYLAVDEAHRLKNNESALHEVLKLYHTGNRLLVTGTPLQNSLKELWNLLNFLMPNKFHSLSEFQEQYSDLKEKDQITELHNILKPHLLRRIKKDVEKSLPPKTEKILRVDFTPLQKKYYKWILAKNFSELNKGVKGEKTTLLNIVTELKKTCNHPYLFESAIQESDGSLDQMIKGSGKLILLDKLLIRLKETGHRVLIFSQMVRMLDILAEYLRGRNFHFQRLDGSMSNDKRNIAMDRFNAPDSHDFCFLLSTRAGGLGINLTTADTVIIFDSDWNPQNDLQAEARAHRIGQKNQVNIYRLVSKGSIEEDILERAKQKMVLDHLVIQSMEKSATAAKNSSNTFNKDDLEKILKFGAADLFKEGDDESNQMPEMDIDEILSRAEPTTNPDQLNNGEMTAGQELLNSFRVANFSTSTKEDVSWDQIIPDSDRKKVVTEEEITLLGPRRREATLKNMPSLSSHEPLSITVKAKKDISFFNNKEFKILIRSLKKFGTHKRAKEVLKDANFPTTKPVRSTEDVCKEIIDSCRKAISDNKEADKVHIVYHGTDINAVEMMQRVQDMEVLSDLCQPHQNDLQNFNVTFPIRPVSWAVKWGPKEDAMLLMGAYKYGVGNWESIQSDQTLGLCEIIDKDEKDKNKTEINGNGSNGNNNNKIKGSTLLRRLEALIKSATDVYMAKRPITEKEQDEKKPLVKSLSRKRVPGRNGSKNNNTKDNEALKKKPLPKYSDDEIEDEIEDDDDDDYKDSKPKPKSSKPLPRKRVKKPTTSNSSRSKTTTTTTTTQSPIRTSSGRMSVPPQKLNSPSGTPTKQVPSKSNLFSDDENPSKRSKSTSNNNNSGVRKALSVLDIAKKCKTLLATIQPSLESFRDLSDQKISREEKLSKTKKYLLEIGDGIESLARSDKSRDISKDKLTKQLWYESSKYTTSNGDDLKNLYEKMKQKENTTSNRK